MIIYISMVIWILIVQLFQRNISTNFSKKRSSYSVSKTTAFFTMGYIVFFIGLRSAGADTQAYIHMFRNTPVGMSQVFENIKNDPKSPGFQILLGFIKTFISENYHVFLFIIAALSGWCLAHFLRKHSQHFLESMMFFMLFGTFTWMINGIRQFLAVVILLLATDYMLQKKWGRYIIFVLLAASIHSSALIILPVTFIVVGKPWNHRTIIAMLICVAVLFFTSEFTNILSWLLENTDYGNEAEQFSESQGMSPLRAVLNSIPCILAFVFRKDLTDKTNKTINFCINMSLLGIGFSLIAVVTSGIYMGRLIVYFTVYNLILLPWILNNVYSVDKKQFKIAVYLLYIVYFVYDCFIAHHYYYISDILHLNLK